MQMRGRDLGEDRESGREKGVQRNMSTTQECILNRKGYRAVARLGLKRYAAAVSTQLKNCKYLVKVSQTVFMFFLFTSYNRCSAVEFDVSETAK